MKKTLLALLAAAAILAPLPAQAAAPAAEQPPQGGILTGMPNPYTEYSTLAEMKQVLGFMPLTMPKDSHFKYTAKYIISGTTADLRFKGDKDETAGIRSARMDIAGMEDISGYYSVQWEDLHISQTDLHIAYLDYDSYVARWTHGKYTFAFNAHAMTREKYHKLLRSLVQTTEQKSDN